MKRSNKKIGLFSNAKYSRPVFRNVPPSVIEKADKDIEALIKPSSRCTRSQRVVQEAPREKPKKFGLKRSHHGAFQGISHVQQTPEVSNCYLDADPLSDHQWGVHVRSRNKEPMKKRHQIVSTRIERRVSAMADASPLGRSIDSDFGFEELTPEKATPLSTENQRYFPSEPPIGKIVHNMFFSFPQLTLKNNEPMEYADAAFTLARNALVTQLNQSSIKNATSHNLANVHLPEAQIDETAFATLRDKTMNFHVDYQAESDEWSQDGKLNDESPTSFHWSFEEVPDPETFPHTYDELGERVEQQVEQYSDYNKGDELFDFRRQVDSNHYAWDLSERAELSSFRSDVISPECERIGRNMSRSQYETSYLSEKKYF